MRPTKRSLSLVRETIRQLGHPALSAAKGGIQVPTISCVPPTQRHSCFDSCYHTDCCLMIP